MALATRFVSISEYLKSDYEPDADYVEGEIEEKSTPEYDHAAWQSAILRWFQDHARDWKIRVAAELRVKVSPTRFRVPDASVLNRDFPIEQIPTKAPVAVFEILSPDDRMTQVIRKLKDYEAMGIPQIWIVDSETKECSRYEAGELLRRNEFVLESKNIRFQLKEIEALLD